MLIDGMKSVTTPEFFERIAKDDIGEDGARKVRAVLEILAIGGDVSVAYAKKVLRAAENAMELRAAVRSGAED